MQWIRLAAVLAPANAGNSSAASKAVIAMTTNSSIRVKPDWASGAVRITGSDSDRDSERAFIISGLPTQALFGPPRIFFQKMDVAYLLYRICVIPPEPGMGNNE